MSLERGIVFEVQKDYESEMLDSLKETVFSTHSKTNKCTRELQRLGQYAQDLNRFKPDKIST